MRIEDVRVAQLEILNESRDVTENLRVRGVFQRADEANNNKRVYPKKILDREIERLRPVFESRQLVGELDHPSDAVVSLKNASHLITNLYWNGKDVIGEAEILPTPAGKIAEALIRSGVKIGISSRGVGSLTEGVNGKIVNEDYQMLTFDLVADPSTKGAYPTIAEQREQAVSFANKYIRPVLGEKVFCTLLGERLNTIKEEKDAVGLRIVLDEVKRTKRRIIRPVKKDDSKPTEDSSSKKASKLPKSPESSQKGQQKKLSRYVRLHVSSGKRPDSEALQKSKTRSRQASQEKGGYQKTIHSLGKAGADVGEYKKIHQQKVADKLARQKRKPNTRLSQVFDKPDEQGKGGKETPESVKKIYRMRRKNKTTTLPDKKKYDTLKLKTLGAERDFDKLTTRLGGALSKKQLDMHKKKEKNPRDMDY